MISLCLKVIHQNSKGINLLLSRKIKKQKEYIKEDHQINDIRLKMIIMLLKEKKENSLEILVRKSKLEKADSTK
jgi:hypothetical protein